jgi:hypothetical protein
MSDDRSFERIAQAWLESGSTKAPERAIAAALRTIDRTPQQRAWFPRRFITMQRTLVVAAAVAALILAVGAGIWLGRSSVSPGGGGSPTPTAATTPAPTPATTPSAIPAALQYQWIGASRGIPVLGTSTRTALNFTTTTFDLTGTQYGYGGELVSSAGLLGRTSLQVISTVTASGCQVGDVGTYPWALSAGGTVLTVQAGTDACATRAAVMPGTWYRQACKDTTDGCFGTLEAGTYPSQYITPRLAAGANWQPDLGAMTYTVPAGWANDSDWPDSFSLTPSSDYALEGPQGPGSTYHQIILLTEPRAINQDTGCQGFLDTQAAPTVSGLVGYLHGLKSITTTAPGPITIDGLAGQWVDATVAPTWKQTCPGSTGPNATLFISANASGGNGLVIGPAGPEHVRLILLDLGAGHDLLIAIDSTDAAGFPGLVQAALPIIQTFKFR